MLVSSESNKTAHFKNLKDADLITPKIFKSPPGNKHTSKKRTLSEWFASMYCNKLFDPGIYIPARSYETNICGKDIVCVL